MQIGVAAFDGGGHDPNTTSARLPAVKMRKSGGQGRRFGLPLLRRFFRREKRLVARLRLLRKKIRAIEAAGAEKFNAAEAAGARKLMALEAAFAAEMKAAEAEKEEIGRQQAAATRRTDAASQVAASSDLQRPFLEFLQHVAPRRVVGRPKARVGGIADGGYVMLDDFAGVRTAISGGIGDDVSWDLEIAERGIDVLQVDNTVPGPPVQHPRFEFRRLRIAGGERPAGRCHAFKPDRVMFRRRCVDPLQARHRRG